MTPHKNDCLTDKELHEFRCGFSIDVATERIASHLGTCEDCEFRLESISSRDDPIVAIIRAPDPFEPWRGEFPQGRESRDAPPFQDSESQKASLDSTRPYNRAEIPVGRAGKSRESESGLPDKIGNYLVLDRLGRGGFGNVYLARDGQNDRLVAIKVPILHSESAVEQFLKEARTAIQLEHPAIVKVFDWGREDDGTCYVVMEYINGQSLRDLMRSGVSHARTASVIKQIATALHHAHSHNIYHRDVKPANILIGENGKPYLTDFGLAIREDERWKYTGGAAGTLPYMSREQVRGETEFVDGRSDIWSLGVVFYEMLTGERPFSGNTEAQLFLEIEGRDPRPPRVISQSIPVRLEKACLKCLEKNISDRYGSARELAAELSVNRGRRAAIGLGVLTLASCCIAFARSMYLGDPGVPMFDREPEAVVRNITNPDNVWIPAPNEGRFEVRSLADVSIAVFGATDQRELVLQTDLNIDGWRGYSGLMWGLHDTRPGKPNTEARCYAAVIGRSEATHPITVEIHRFDLVVIVGQSYIVGANGPLATSRIPEPSSPYVTLRCRLRDQGTISVTIDDVEIEFDRSFSIDLPRSGETGYGVTSVGQRAIFENGRVKFVLK